MIFDRALHLRGIEIDERPAHAAARVVDDDVGRADRASTSANSRCTSSGLRVASHAYARAPVSVHSASSLAGLRAASATCMPSRAKRRASEALRPEPAPTMSARSYLGCSSMLPSS